MPESEVPMMFAFNVDAGKGNIAMHIGMALGRTDDKATKDTATDPEIVSFVALVRVSLLDYLSHELVQESSTPTGSPPNMD